ncbi:MAG TPA: hypothetical protein VMH05_02935 [Bryobacteraceae bacterium]|nr:hypothetical protein [Bryobacteraceae bacterium]
MRSAYLQGAYEGDGLCRVIANATIGWPTSLTFEEIEQALDLFYKEPTNASIPVLIGGVYYVKRKAEGASEAELKQLEVDLRKRSH